jgi:chlorophyllide a reductase subunit Z
MGYAGTCYLVQEVCNALFDALFNVLPLGTDLDKVEATPARAAETLIWADTAQNGLDRIVARNRFWSHFSGQATARCRRAGRAGCRGRHSRN